MKTKASSLSNVVLILCFCVFLAGIMLYTTFSPKETYSYYENRNLSVMPELTAEGLITGQWGANMDQYLSDHAAWRDDMLKANTWISLYLLQQPLVNDVVVTEECLLPEIPEWMQGTYSIEADTALITENLLSLSKLTERYGGHYYYVAVPCQYAFFNDQYPWYMNNREDYTAESLACLSASLEQAGVNFIDIGEVFAREGWPAHLASAIDNHSSIFGAYLTYLEIMQTLNADTGLNLDILREGDYEITELPNPYLGSRTRKLLDLWPNKERLGILTPNNPIHFTRKNNGTEVAATVYRIPKNETEDVLYNLYMGGDIALTEIDTDREDLPTILVYGDSFTNAVECMLYYGFNKMYSIDMRHYKASSLGEFISTYQPDIVVCIRDYQALLTPTDNGCGAQSTGS